MFCDGADPGGLVEVWATETWISRIETAKQIADVRNRWGPDINVVSIFSQGEPITSARVETLFYFRTLGRHTRVNRVTETGAQFDTGEIIETRLCSAIRNPASS